MVDNPSSTVVSKRPTIAWALKEWKTLIEKGKSSVGEEAQSSLTTEGHGLDASGTSFLDQSTLGTAVGKSSSQGFNAGKFNQRLKEMFKERIGQFREAVYLLTGFKVLSGGAPMFS